MKKNTLNLISSLVFLVVVLYAIFAVWRIANTVELNLTANYSVGPEFSGIEQKATKLLSGLENNAGIPLPTPTDKMGKSNPFTSP
jgi:hypothetical protein